MRKTIAFAALVCLCVPAVAQSGVVLKIDSVTVPVSSSLQTGWLYVYAEHDETVNPTLQSFNLDVEVDSPWLQLSDAVQPDPLLGDTRDYILPSGFGLLPTYTSSGVNLFDEVFTLIGGFGSPDELVSGRAFAKIEYTLFPGLTGFFPVVFNVAAAPFGISPLVDGDGNPIEFTVENGGVLVQNAPAVPEPATLLLLSGIMGGLIFWFHRRRN